MSIFGRISTAMVTPFDAKGNIDFQKTSHLVEYLLKNGSDSLVISGTTGESPTLTFEEKAALFKHVVNVVGKRVPVIAGTGNYNTKDSIELTKKPRTLVSMPFYSLLLIIISRIKKVCISILSQLPKVRVYRL